MKKPLYPDGYSQTLSDIIDVLKTGLNDCGNDDAEDSLLARLRDYLLTTNKGLALLGQQYGMTVDNDTISIDLLFYHIPLQCYFAVELMPCSCSPADASQLTYYLAALDHMLASPYENPSIGLLVTKDGSRLTAKYSIRTKGTSQKVFDSALVADDELSDELKVHLPSTVRIEKVFR